jgi:excisionase family DNA binding protein
VENLADTQRSHTLLKEISRKLDRLLERADVSSTSGALMSVKDAARFLALSERAIRNRIATRAWPAYRYGTAVRVNPHELKALMGTGRK